MNQFTRLSSVLIAGFALICALPALAQRQKDLCISSATMTLQPTTAKPGGKATLVITLQMKDQYHIYDANPGIEGMIPTTFKPSALSGLTFGKPIFPTPHLDKGARTHGGKVIIKVPVSIAKSVKAGTLNVGGEIKLQACNESGCLPPFSLKLSSKLKVK